MFFLSHFHEQKLLLAYGLNVKKKTSWVQPVISAHRVRPQTSNHISMDRKLETAGPAVLYL
jgi:hypothetical protein